MKNNIVKDGFGGYTPLELALLDWATIYNIWNHIETGEEDFLYHMVIFIRVGLLDFFYNIGLCIIAVFQQTELKY